MKEKIEADGNTTRALINANTIQDLRDRAAKAETQLAAYFTRVIPPILPVPVA